MCPPLQNPALPQLLQLQLPIICLLASVLPLKKNPICFPCTGFSAPSSASSASLPVSLSPVCSPLHHDRTAVVPMGCGGLIHLLSPPSSSPDPIALPLLEVSSLAAANRDSQPRRLVAFPRYFPLLVSKGGWACCLSPTYTVCLLNHEAVIASLKVFLKNLV